MKTNIFIPSKINVGFQNRKDTYTGKLAYVIYYDEKGKLRKEPSWQSWRDKDIPNEVFDNEPIEGFVLNKKVGGNNYSWNPRKTYTRVYDPRGFEFEITIPNLLWILENCNCIKGKGLEGQFVYGWDGKELVLVPVDSPDYREIQEKNKVIYNNEFIKAKDLILGATYETLNGEKYVYMGKYDAWDIEYNHYRNRNWLRMSSNWDFDLDNSWHDDKIFGNKEIRFKYVNVGKHFWFIHLGNPDAEYSWERNDTIAHYKTITRKFSRLVSTDTEKYAEYYSKLEHYEYFSPIDFSKNKIHKTTYEDFEKHVLTKMAESQYAFGLTYLKDGYLSDEMTIHININGDKKEFYFYRYNSTLGNSVTVFVTPDNIKELYEFVQPMYGEQYLENGKLLRRRGYYGTEE